MITNLNEINRVLLSVRQLTARSKQVHRTWLVQHMEGEVILGRNPEFEPVLDYLGRMGLILENRRGVGLTDFGFEVLAENKMEMYELQPKQRRLLVRKCYLDGALRSEMKRFVRKLSAEPPRGRIMWSAIDSEPLENLEWLIDHLVQLGVLSPQDETLVVTPAYKYAISQFMDESADFTEEQFERWLREKRVVGDTAEAFVIEFERARLSGGGHRLESACVQRISNLRVNAGYDINSFDGRSRHLSHDRFIEVKGSGKTTVRFVWTPNEMKKAAELGDKYWIYFVGGIHQKKGLVTRSPVMIQDPHIRFRSEKSFQVQPSGSVLVEANITGALLSPVVQISIR